MYIIDIKKKIKEKTDDVMLINRERYGNAKFVYSVSEKQSNNIIKPSKTFEEYTLEIIKINEEIRDLKSKLRQANETICDNGNTISDNIFLLKQSAAECHNLENSLVSDQVKRVSNGFSQSKEVEYEEANYKIDWLKDLISYYKAEITTLQNSIDRANLTTILD